MQNRYSLIVTALGSREGTQDSPFPISVSSPRAFCRMQDKKKCTHLLFVPPISFEGKSSPALHK